MNLNNLVDLFFGNLPEEFEFIKIFGYFIIIYIFLGLFKLFIDIIRELI